MKKNSGVVTAIFLMAVPTLYARPAQSNSRQFVQGTVIQVQKHRVESPAYQFGSGNPADAPLATRYYSYEVSIRVDCKTYVGRYTTPFNYLPSAFTADKPIQLRLTKHVMYFELPYGDVRMGIVRRTTGCSADR